MPETADYFCLGASGHPTWLSWAAPEGCRFGRSCEHPGVLGLARVQVALLWGAVLCPGSWSSADSTAVDVQPKNTACTAARGSPTLGFQWGGEECWEGTQLGQLTLTKEQSHPRTLCSAVKAQGKEEQFHSPLLHLSSQLLYSTLKMAEQLPTNRKYWAYSSFWFACTHGFCFPY